MKGKTGYAWGLAWHGMRCYPRSSLMVVAVIALGLAASMSVLTVFHTLAAKPLPDRAGQVQTMLFKQHGQRAQPVLAMAPVPLLEDLVNRMPDADVAALIAGYNTVQADGSAKQIAGKPPEVDFDGVLASTSRLHRIFGITLERGRWWTAIEDREQAPVAVISPDLAKQLYGSQDVLGRSVRINGMALRIIGVRARWHPSMKFYSQGGGMYEQSFAQVMLPLSVAKQISLGLQAVNCPGAGPHVDQWTQCRISQLWAYGLSSAQQARWMDLAASIAQRFPKPQAGNGLAVHPQPVSLDQWMLLRHAMPDSVRAYAWVAVAFLALCLFNAAGVLTARFLRRGAELGIRRALGASRQDVFGQHLIESGGLALVGGILALPLMWGLLALLRVQAVAYADLIQFDTGAFLALAAATVLTGLLVGIYPSWRAAVVPPALQVKQN